MKKNIKYPRYTREQDGRCKLNDDDIAEIRELKKYGLLNKEIAGLFNIFPSTARYWLDNSVRKDVIQKAIESRYKHLDKKINKIRRKKAKIKKLKLCPEFRKYENIRRAISKSKNHKLKYLIQLKKVN